ncbi:hypothetical protein [Nocardia sp. NPDC019304]
MSAAADRPAPGHSSADVFDTGTLDRLRKLEQARDPQGVFRASFPISG